MKTKIILEINDGGFSVQRKELAEGENIVAMSFKSIGEKEYDANLAVTGSCSKETVMNYATATTLALARMTNGKLMEPLYWKLFTDTFLNCMKRESEKKADKYEKDFVHDLSKKGMSNEEIDQILNAIRETARREAENDYRK